MPRSSRYEPRSPAQGVLYQVVREHYETFRAQTDRACDGAGLPRFVQAEFEGFLRCGFLAGGFARFQCERCRHEHLLPFSCKARAICPSCGGRRMAAFATRFGEPRRSLGGGGAERAAHLVDHVFPVVPIRQWVLTLPHRVRYVLAWDHVLCRAVMRIFMTAVLGSVRRRARRTQGVAGGRSGAVVIVQRFGSALNTNVHGHALVLDGVFAEEGAGALRFHPAPPPTDEDMDDVLAAIRRRVRRLLARRGVPEEPGEAEGAPIRGPSGNPCWPG